MSTTQGFKNCPSVTAFAVGMEFLYNPNEITWRVVHRGPHKSLCVDVNDQLRSSYFSDSEIVQCTICLSVPWVGQQYKARRHDWTAEVLAVCGDQIGYICQPIGLTNCHSREVFLGEYEAIPLDSEAPCVGVAESKPTTDDYLRGHRASGIEVGDTVKVLRKAEDCEGGWNNWWLDEMDSTIGQEVVVVGDKGINGFELRVGNDPWCFPYFVLEEVTAKPEAEPWKPQKGDTVRITVRVDGPTTTVVDVCERHARCRTKGGHEACWYHNELVLVPPESPVKIGDILLLTYEPDKKKIAGIVTEVYAPTKEFYIDGFGMFSWSDPSMKITKLVPEKSKQ